MTTGEIIGTIFAFLSLFGGIVAVFTKMRVDVASINVKILQLEKEINSNKVDGTKYMDNNRTDHKQLFDKIDELKDFIIELQISA